MNFLNTHQNQNYLKCDCKINQDNIELEKPEKFTAKSIIKSFVNVFKYSNYKVLKCSKLVFKGETFYDNIGSVLSLIYFFGFLFSLGLFCFKRINHLSKEMLKILDNKMLEISNNDNDKLSLNNDKNRNQI